jgi:signal transduction histidine kinase
MLTSVSHDLRTPLTRLRLRTEAIEEPALRQRMLQDLHVMDSMVTSALSFLRDQNAPEVSEQVDLPALVQTICDQFTDLGQTVVYAGPPHLSIACRPDAMQQAITNLIDNAVKFAESITVRLQPYPPAGIRLEIEDDGPGVPDAEKALVFGPFYRSDPSRRLDTVPGFGLGLSIARRIIESHGGTIELCDHVPHGLIVRVTLPA